MVGIEAHPVNFAHAYASMQGVLRRPQLPRMRIMPLALSNKSSMLALNIGVGGLQGLSPLNSILEPVNRAFWQAASEGHTAVPSVRLDYLLRMVPKEYNFTYWG